MATHQTPTFFKSAKSFRTWLAKHGSRKQELVVGFHKVATGKPCMTWPESVDEALCFGWIDGLRKKIDDESYLIRFTPRRPTSVWSAINIEKVRALEAQGRMTEAGRLSFARRNKDKSAIYSYEVVARAKLAPQDEAALKKNKAAWAFFDAQPPSYKRLVFYYVSSAKQVETRQRRLAKVIDASAKGKRL